MWPLLPFFLLLVPPAKGFTYFVKNNLDSQGLCVTDQVESAVAVSPQKAEQWRPPKYDARDCILSDRNVCNNDWDRTQFVARKNFFFADQFGGHDIFDPVLDARWHSFPPVVSNGTLEYLFDMGAKKEHIRFHTSVLCTGGVWFLFAADKNSGNGYFVYLQKSASSNKANIEVIRCSNWQEYTNNRCPILVNEEISVFMSDTFWYTLTFKFNDRSKGFKWELNGQQLDLSKQYNHVHVYCKGIFKLHAYNYLQSNSRTGILQRTFQHMDEEPLCVDITYAGIPETGATISVSQSATKKRELDISVRPSALSWQTSRLEGNLRPGRYKMTVSVNSTSFYIGGVHFCKKGELMLTSLGKGEKCQHLKTNTLTSVANYPSNSFYPKVTVGIVNKICSAIGSNDCKNVEACDTTGCFCLSGHKRSTNNTTSCSNDDLLGFDKHEPTITAINAYAVEFSVATSLKRIKESKDKKYFKEAIIQIQKVEFLLSRNSVVIFNSKKGESKWTLNTTFGLDAQIIEVAGLQQNTSYEFRAFIIEQDAPLQKVQSGYFQTRKCTPNDIQTISIGENNLIAQKKENINLCKILHYVVKLNDGTEILTNLSFTDDNSQTISNLLKEYKELKFEFVDAFGATTLLIQPGVSASIVVIVIILAVSLLLVTLAAIAVLYRRRHKIQNPPRQPEARQSAVYCEAYELKEVLDAPEPEYLYLEPIPSVQPVSEI